MRRRDFVVASSALVLSSCVTTPEEGVPPDHEGGEQRQHPLSGLTNFAGAAVKHPPILGRPATLIDFWASWCVPCRQSFRHLDQLYRTWLGKGLDMVAISVDDDPVAARRFFSQFRPRFPVAWDANAVVRERFGVVSLPTTVLLDGEGSMVHRNVGFQLSDHRYLEEQIRRLVESAAEEEGAADEAPGEDEEEATAPPSPPPAEL